MNAENTHQKAKTEMRMYVSNFRILHMQFCLLLSSCLLLSRQLAAVLDGITIYISVPPLKIKDQRLFDVHAVIKNTNKRIYLK